MRGSRMQCLTKISHQSARAPDPSRSAALHLPSHFSSIVFILFFVLGGVSIREYSDVETSRQIQIEKEKKKAKSLILYKTNK